MPSPGEDIQSWSVTANNNGAADPLINWAEGQARASVNNSSRSEMAAHAKNRNLLNGSIVTTGTANAQAFLSGVTYTTVPTGLIVKLKVGAGLTNTGPTTLNMDGIGAVAVKTADGIDVLGGEFVAGCYVDLAYNGTNWVWLYGREFLLDRINGGGGIIVGTQSFTTPGTFTYTPTPGTDTVIVECIGAGGGGGGAYAPADWGQGAPGGGGGSYSRSILTAAQIGTSKSVVVGAGGQGGSPVGPQPGASGAATTFGGSLVVANGGYGGSGAYGVTQTQGGVGGAIGTGNVVATAGSHGEAGHGVASITTALAHSGSGGPGPLGGRGTSFDAGGAGNVTNANAPGYGGGGGGGVGWNGDAYNGVGGNGAGGLCLVTEFAGRGTPGRDGAQGAQGPQGPAGPSGPGTGDVLRSGTPTAGQIAEWIDSNHIRGIAPPTGFTTGDAKITLKTVADTGWVMMNDGTIGNTGSGATTRANADCQSLYTLIWSNVSDTYAPVTGGRGASANADWTANKAIQLTRQLGRSLSIAGTGAGLSACALGQYDGEETHTLTVAELANHAHAMGDHQHVMNDHTHIPPSGYPYFGATDGSTIGVTAGASPIYDIRPASATSGMTASIVTTGMTAATNTAAAGSSTPMNVRHPRSFWNVMIKL
jgi:hypothetical protein